MLTGSKGISKKILLFYSVFALLTIPAFSQVKEWGDVSRDKLAMEVYRPDSSAAAVVLFDKGNLRIEDNLQYFLDRHIRIKLLRPEGYKWATVNLIYNKDYGQEIDELKAVTYTLHEKSQEIVKHRVEEDAFFMEDLFGEWSRVTFTFPSLEPGCIIEYKYTKKIGHPAYIPIWYFDRTIPVKWSELRAELPAFFKFTTILKGAEELDKNIVKSLTKTIMIEYEEDIGSYGTSKTIRNRVTFNGNTYRWIMKGRPGIPKLPFMATPNNYKAGIALQLSEINIPEYDYQEDIAKTWSSVIADILNDEQIQTYLKLQNQYQDIISSVNASGGPKIKRTKKIFNYVANTFTWNKMHDLYGSVHSLENLLSSKTGSGVDLNLLLTGLLQQAGVTAYPVLISTRDNGFVLQDYVLPDQFNHLIVLAIIDGQRLLLDASRGSRSLKLLPVSDLNGKGLVVTNSNPGNEIWVSLIPPQPTGRATSLQAKINDDGSLTGTISGVSTGYFAFKDRMLINKAGRKSFFNQQIFNHFADYNTTSRNISNIAELDSTLKYKAILYSSPAAETQVVDSTIYLDAMPVMKWVENPLKQEDRKYPVVFPYRYSEHLMITYIIPAGYEVLDYPDKLITRIANGGGMFKRTVQVNGSRIELKSVLKLGRTRYEPSEYDRLKLFFDQIIEAYSEKIVLQKSAKK